MQRLLVFSMCIVASFVVCHSVGQSDDFDASSSHQERILELAESYLTHRQSLDPLTCEFTVENFAPTSSLQQLIAGEIEKRGTSDGRLLLREDLVFYSSISRQPIRIESFDEATGIRETSGVSTYFLASSDGCLHLHGHAAALAAAEDHVDYLGTGIHPLNLGSMGASEQYNPHALILRCIDTAYYLGERTHFGVDIEGVSIPQENGGDWIHVWFAPDWEYLPARIEVHSEDYISVSIVIEVEQTSDDQWFPKNVLRYRGAVEQLEAFENGTLSHGDKFFADRIFTESVGVATLPDEGDFHLVLPALTSCQHGDQYLNVQEQRTIFASKIREFLEEIDRKSGQ